MEARASEAEDRILHSSTKEEALENAILATEIYLKAIISAGTKSERERLKLKCTAALARAEDIKQVKIWSGRVEQTNQQPFEVLLRPPVSVRRLSTREEVIVLESSRLNGFTFSPWTSEPAEELFQRTARDNLYVDVSEFSFSKSQQIDFAGWRRPYEVFGKRRVRQYGTEVEAEPGMEAKMKIDLVQDVTADCSVVAGLCAAVSRAEGDFEKLLCTVFYPYDKIKSRPMISENGKYIFRFNFNGSFRHVAIDDRLPDSRSTRTLYVFDRQNPNLLWPALLEKAYLKVRGGYDFPGSNSGTDLWVLISWIPEQILLHSDEINPQELWRRIFTSYGFGDVIITLGTGRLGPTEENEFGLIGEHDYAVLNLKENSGRRELLIKNPWRKGPSWRGSTVAAPFDDGQKGANLEETNAITQRVSGMFPNTFWIDFDEALQNFQSLYLNWNPGLFRYRQDHHFSWMIPSQAPPASFINNPQYSIKSGQGGPVWVLLSRHFNTEEQNILNSSSRDAAVGSPLGFISLYVFDVDGKQVYLSDDALIRGPFVDSPQTLLRLDLPPMACYTLAAAHQSLPLPKYSFTITAFSRTPVAMSQATNPYPCRNSIRGAWTSRTAGGNAGSPSYASNPQFRLSITSTSSLILFLETTQPELPIHVKLVWANGQRVTAITTKDILCESGEYRRGCTLAELPTISAGIYTIICSTFSAGQSGNFTLRIDSTVDSELTPIPAEEAGRLIRTLPPLVFETGLQRVLTPFTVSHLSWVSIVARHALTHSSAEAGAREKAKARSALKIILEQGQGPHKTTLAESCAGNFSDAPSGVRITDVDINPQMFGELWLVVARLGDVQAVEEIEVEVYSECVIEVGDWGRGEG